MARITVKAVIIYQRSDISHIFTTKVTDRCTQLQLQSVIIIVPIAIYSRIYHQMNNGSNFIQGEPSYMQTYCIIFVIYKDFKGLINNAHRQV